MSDADYTNLDLDTAEQLLLDAGRPDEAAALRRYSHGIRNMMQAAVVPGFVRTLEIVVSKQIGALTASIAERDAKEFERRVEWRERTDKRFDNFGNELDAGFAEVRGLRGDFTALQAEFQAVGATVDGLVETVGHVQSALADLNRRHGEQWREVTDRISKIEAILRDRPAQRAAEQQAYEDRMRAFEAELARLRARVARLDRGGGDAG